MRYIGTKASSMIAGVFSLAITTMNPRLAARLYAGAVDAIPITTLDTRPSAPPFSPLVPGAVPAVSDVWVLMLPPAW